MLIFSFILNICYVYGLSIKPLFGFIYEQQNWIANFIYLDFHSNLVFINFFPELLFHPSNGYKLTFHGPLAINEKIWNQGILDPLSDSNLAQELREGYEIQYTNW